MRTASTQKAMLLAEGVCLFAELRSTLKLGPAGSEPPPGKKAAKLNSDVLAFWRVWEIE